MAKKQNKNDTVDLYSFSDPKKANGKTTRQKIKLAVNIIASIFLSLAIIACAGSVATLVLKDEKLFEEDTEETVEYEERIYSVSTDVTYILILGVDVEETLTDIMIVACIDHKNGTLNFLQIPRDTFIGTDVNTSKANAVYGNPRKGEKPIYALWRRINSYFGIPIDYYVKFTIKGFSNVIDALGGVTVDIETPNANGVDIMNPFTHKHERVGPGVTKLSGPQAVGFVRKRTGQKDGYIKGDIDRIEAQRAVYVALAQKLQSMSLNQMTTIAKKCYNEIETDMTVNEILSYAEEVKSIPMSKMGIYAVPGQFETYNGLSMWSPHKDEYIDIFNQYFNPYGGRIEAGDIKMIELHKELGHATRKSEVEQGGSLDNVKK